MSTHKRGNMLRGKRKQFYLRFDVIKLIKKLAKKAQKSQSEYISDLVRDDEKKQG